MAANNLFQSDDLHGGSQAPTETTTGSNGMAGLGKAISNFGSAADKMQHNESIASSQGDTNNTGTQQTQASLANLPKRTPTPFGSNS